MKHAGFMGDFFALLNVTSMGLDLGGSGDNGIRMECVYLVIWPCCLCLFVYTPISLEIYLKLWHVGGPPFRVAIDP